MLTGKQEQLLSRAATLMQKVKASRAFSEDAYVAPRSQAARQRIRLGLTQMLEDAMAAVLVYQPGIPVAPGIDPLEAMLRISDDVRRNGQVPRHLNGEAVYLIERVTDIVLDITEWRGRFSR